MKSGEAVAIGIGLAGLVGIVVLITTNKKVEEVPPEEILPEEAPPEEVETISATLRDANVWWAGLVQWISVYTNWLNQWPVDTDITLAWKIKNTGNVGAYFQVYMFDPGDWLYLNPGDEAEVFESLHTPAVPVTPGYQFYLIKILGRKINGERVGEVWSSDEVEVHYA